MPSSRQTISFLARRFKEAGIRLDTKKGQNFLIDLNLVHVLAESADLGPRDVVLEIGTGIGSLTTLLARRAAAVVTVELDPQLHHLAREELIDFDNVTMLQQDALKNKNTLHPNLIAAVRQHVQAAPDRRLKLVANLPYNIATPVISNLLTTDLLPISMTVTIQRELADRITARPNTRDYGALSVWIQSQCRTARVRAMPPSVFWPRPKVHSAMVHIQLDQALRNRIPDPGFFHTFVRSMFLHRRKYLRGVLLSALNKQLTKPQVDHVMAQLGLGVDCRAEQLDVDVLIALCEAVRAEVES
jgi:16S rRNA (adenine1518-N6/adenine1519-N6)-dimethyltransferase